MRMAASRTDAGPGLAAEDSAFGRYGRAPARSVSKRLRRMRYYAAAVFADCAILVGAFLIGNIIRFGDVSAPPGMIFAAFFVPLYLLMALQQRCYCSEILYSWKRSAWRSLTSLAAATMVIVLVAFYVQTSVALSRAVFTIGCAATGLAFIFSRWLLCRIADRVFEGSPLNQLVLCDGVGAPELAGFARIDAQILGLRPDLKDPHMLDRLGHLLNDVERVVVACPQERRGDWAKILRGANLRGEFLSPEMDDAGLLGSAQYGQSATLVVSWGPLNTADRMLKRLVDLALSVATLFTLAPALIIVAIAIKLDSKGPVFFVQPRLGRGNRLFMMYKFRSMHTASCDNEGRQSTMRDDKRVTRVGALIRRTSIDEIPQILNVFKGDMSFVGPRPHALGSLAGNKLFWEVDSRYWCRHAAKPGITGLAQVKGFRGATHAQSDLVDRLQADLEYLHGWSIWRDFVILAATFKVVLHKNAY